MTLLKAKLATYLDVEHWKTFFMCMFVSIWENLFFELAGVRIAVFSY